MERPRSQAASGGGDSEALRAYVAEQVDAMAGLRQELEDRMHGVVGAQVPLLLLLPSHPSHDAQALASVVVPTRPSGPYFEPAQASDR